MAAQDILGQKMESTMGFPGATLLEKRATKPAMHLLEIVVWTLVAFLGAGAMRIYRPMPLGNDSYQYLNVAEHYRHDHQLATSLVHFDTERSQGRMPAPLITFPPGYPFVLGILSFSHDIEHTARLLSGISYAGTAALLAWGLILMGVAFPLRQLTLLILASNVVALGLATEVLTDPLYMLLSTGAVVGLIWAETRALTKPAVIAGAVVALSVAGLASWIRYVGLFLIAALVSYFLLRLLLPSARFRVVFLLVALIPISLAAGLLTRNLVTGGTWKGGNAMLVHKPLKGVMVDYVRAQVHLILGEHAITFGVWEGLLLAGALAIVAFLIAAVRKSGNLNGGPVRIDSWMHIDARELLLGVCILIYSAGVIYSGLRMVISFGSRYFLPMLPLYLLGAGVAANWLTCRWQSSPHRRWLTGSLLLVIVGCVGVNARDLYEHSQAARHEILAAEFAEPASDGRPLLAWIDAHVSDRGVIIAADGQATGYLLHRPTISMVSARYTPVRWECDEVKRLMKQFNANYVFLYKPSPMTNEEDLLADSKFVATSVSGPPSCGFVIAAENADVRILESPAR